MFLSISKKIGDLTFEIILVQANYTVSHPSSHCYDNTDKCTLSYIHIFDMNRV